MVSRGDLVPYLSVVCAAAGGSTPPVTDLLAAVQALVEQPAANAVRTTVTTIAPATTDGLRTAALVYEEQRPPRWHAAVGFDPESAEFVDVTHHLVVVARRGEKVAIYTSDPAIGRQIGNRIDDPEHEPFGKLARFTADQLQGAFLRGRTRTLWMSGLHRSTATKADSKVLSGSDLRAALDPLGDQSFRFTAARATNTLADGNGGTAAVVGVSPNRSRIWAGPSRSWNDFSTRLTGLLDALEDAEPEPTPLPVVAQLITDVAGLLEPYDVAAIDPILLGVDAHDSQEDQELAEKWADRATFEVDEVDEPTAFKLQVTVDDEDIGQLSVQLTPGPLQTCKLDVQPVGAAPTEQLAEAAAVLGRPGWATIRYGSGHTYQDGRLYAVRFRDRPFEAWQWHEFYPPDRVFAVKKEKPTPADNPHQFLPDQIGAADDKSLFTWTVEHYLGDTGFGARGWLACDDGSGEIADFIHIDDEAVPAIVRLIHVKGAKSASQNRKVSASAYEIVIGQAVKNLRFLDNSNLAERLAVAADRPVAAATWHNRDRQADRSGLLDVAAGLSTNVRQEVVVLQPHVTKPAIDKVRGLLDDKPTDQELNRVRQLDALLLGAEASCRDLGATFAVYGDDLTNFREDL